MPAAPRPGSPTHVERLWPGPLGWALVVGFAGLCVIALLPVAPAAALVAGAVGLAGGVAGAVAISPRVAVEGGELRAGRAHVPVALLGEVRELDRAGVRAALGPGSDARAYVLVRAWLPGAVQVVLADPADPTPSWLVSSRRPARLRAALEAARSGHDPQAAHSEQIG